MNDTVILDDRRAIRAHAITFCIHSEFGGNYTKHKINETTEADDSYEADEALLSPTNEVVLPRHSNRTTAGIPPERLI